MAQLQKASYTLIHINQLAQCQINNQGSHKKDDGQIHHHAEKTNAKK